MRGVTLQEAQVLREMASPIELDVRDDGEREVLDNLVEQGRAVLRVEKWEDEEYEHTRRRWDITAQGREALRLFEKLRGDA